MREFFWFLFQFSKLNFVLPPCPEISEIFDNKTMKYDGFFPEKQAYSPKFDFRCPVVKSSHFQIIHHVINQAIQLFDINSVINFMQLRLLLTWVTIILSKELVALFNFKGFDNQFS